MRLFVLLLIAVLLPTLAMAQSRHSNKGNLLFDFDATTPEEEEAADSADAPADGGGGAAAESDSGTGAASPSVQSVPAAPPLPPAIRERAAAEAGKPRISQAWARAGAIGGNTALYMTLTGGVQDDRVLRISTAWAEKAELHETVIDAQGVAKMLPAQDGFDLPARGSLAFAPGGRHVMVMGLKRDLRVGQRFPVIVTFEKAGTIRVMVEVRGQPAAPRPAAPAASAAEDNAHEGHH